MNKLSTSIYTSILCICGLLWCRLPAQAANVDEAKLRNAVVVGKWHEVVKQVTRQDAELTAAHYILLGHACLALNQNNRSSECFAKYQDDDSHAAWAHWTSALVQDSPSSSNAWYLEGDARARKQNWEGAQEAFEQALKLDPSNHLALNSMGVVQHAIGNTIKARVFFINAIKSNADFADAHASRATLSVFQSSSEPRESFEKAIKLSKDKQPALFLNGSGCMAFGEGKTDEAMKYFSAAESSSEWLTIATYNKLALEAETLKREVERAKNLGTSIVAMKFNDRGIPFDQDPDGIGPDEGIVDIQIGEDGTVYIRLTSGRLVVIPPSGEQGEDDEDEGPDDDPDPQPEPVPGGTEAEPVGALFRGLRPPPTRREMDLIVSAVRGMSKHLAERNRARVADAVSGRIASPTQREVGGADSDSSKVPTNEGNWPVRSSYGLMYTVSGNSEAK